MFVSTCTSDTAVSSGGRNVLALLDQRVPTSFYWSLTLLATIGSTGWLIQGESFLTVIRGQAAAAAASVDWAANFVLIEVFPTWQSSTGLGWIMACFAGIALVAIGFIYRFLPETKNRSVEEITQLFERQAAGGRRAGMTSARDADAAAA
jgi:Sugar (and other) transporter